MSRSPIQTFQEHPILFSGPLVRAILDGKKTQTRRIIRPPHGIGWVAGGPIIRTAADLADPWFRWEREQSFAELEFRDVRCPLGKPGDRLWVRETWRLTDFASYDTDRYSAAVEMRADGARPFRKEGGPEMLHERCDWRPSIHMPRWASRISLEVTDVRVQRLQEITEAEIGTEGVRLDDGGVAACAFERAEYYQSGGSPIGGRSPEVCGFAALWDSIYGRSAGGSWGENPWVWAVSFKRVQP